MILRRRHVRSREPQPVDLLWLEPVSSGSAARTHLDGTLRRLSWLGIEPRHVICSDTAGRGVVQKLRRLKQLVSKARRVRNKGILISRWHPFLALVAARWHKDHGRVVLLVQGNDETVYESYPWFRKVPFSDWMIRRSLNAGDEVLVLNDGLRAWVNDVRGPEKKPAQLLDTGVSDIFLQAVPREGEPRNYALFFGNLARWQGIDYILEAKNSPAWPSDVPLVVVGDGEMYEVVAAQSGDGIRALGKLGPEELAPLVANALVTLCTKGNYKSMAQTTTPFKMLESAAAGVPVIATDIPAQRALLEADEYGLLVSVEDSSELALAVARIREDSELRERLAQNARQVARRLSWDHGAPRLKEAIDSASR